MTWAVPADAPAGEQAVILSVRDGKGQEPFHTFTLRMATDNFTSLRRGGPCRHRAPASNDASRSRKK